MQRGRTNLFVPSCSVVGIQIRILSEPEFGSALKGSSRFLEWSISKKTFRNRVKLSWPYRIGTYYKVPFVQTLYTRIDLRFAGYGTSSTYVILCFSNLDQYELAPEHVPVSAVLMVEMFKDFRSAYTGKFGILYLLYSSPGVDQKNLEVI